MKSVSINKEKKSHILRGLTNTIVLFGSFLGSFYLNYKFIGGNTLVDIGLFLLSIVIVIGISQMCKTSHHHNVSERKIKKIEEILHAK